MMLLIESNESIPTSPFFPHQKPDGRLPGMNENPLKQGILTEHSVGLGSITRKLVRERAVELAIIDGRSAQSVSKSDWDQAKLELTGTNDTADPASAAEELPESERWDPVPGSTGAKVQPTAGEDEDAEGRSDNQNLVEEGVASAEHDLKVVAARNVS